jgi:hypothetical protein
MLRAMPGVAKERIGYDASMLRDVRTGLFHAIVGLGLASCGGATATSKDALGHRPRSVRWAGRHRLVLVRRLVRYERNEYEQAVARTRETAHRPWPPSGADRARARAPSVSECTASLTDTRRVRRGCLSSAAP